MQPCRKGCRACDNRGRGGLHFLRAAARGERCQCNHHGCSHGGLTRQARWQRRALRKQFYSNMALAPMDKAQAAINSIANDSCTHRPREASLGPALRRGAGHHGVIELRMDGNARRLWRCGCEPRYHLRAVFSIVKEAVHRGPIHLYDIVGRAKHLVLVQLLPETT